MSSFQHTAAVAALVSLLIERSLNAGVNPVLAEGRLVATDVAVNIFEFRGVAIYFPYIAYREFLFRWLVLFLDNQEGIVLIGDWNAILDCKIDWVEKGARWSGRWERSLIDFMACHDLVDRFRLDYPEKEM